VFPYRLAPVPNVLVDIVAWAMFHGLTGYAVHRLPLARLQRDTWLLHERRFERAGRLYERLGIRAWKDRLPEAGALFAGGMSKRHIRGRDVVSLERFAAETRRAEYGHWAAMACGPLFVLWNPPIVAAVMVAYGIGVNLPFIAIQRYNRQRIGRLLARRTSRSSTATGPERTCRRDGETNGSSIP
jgi:glycosyl-4,4'-diaponeurosporenoate acyltransferase